MHLAQITEKIAMPQGVTATLQGNTLLLKGAKGEVSRTVATKKVHVSIEQNHIVFIAKNATKNDKCTLQTNTAHVRNMVKGVTQGHIYKLKICSGHFPMTVTLKGDMFEVKNLFGEAVPRRLKLKPGSKVTLAGNDITVESAEKEVAGTQAAALELLTRRPGFDTRVFQDGIYIVEKDGKKIA